MTSCRRTLLALTVTSLGFSLQSHAQSSEEDKLVAAALSLQEFQQDRSAAIPPQILQEARGIAVLPNVIRAGFLFGGRRGKGVAVIRSENGSWSNPLFITMTGGSFGAQIGGESTDVVLVFGNERSVRNIGTSKFTLGGDASATAGPIGRGSRGATDMTFTSEVYYYARARGLFAGAVVEGAKLDVDELANENFYSALDGVEPLAVQSIATPAVARRFLVSLEQAEALTTSPVNEAEATEPGAQEEAQEEAVIYPLGEQPPSD